MSDEPENLIRRLIGGDDTAATQIRLRATSTHEPALLVAAALLAANRTEGGGRALLARAAQDATSTRDRQLVAVAAAHLDDDEELLDVLVRDHLADHPDNILAAWIAAQHTSRSQPDPVIP